MFSSESQRIEPALENHGYQTGSSVARGGDDCAEKASRGDGVGLTLHTVTWTDDADACNFFGILASPTGFEPVLPP
jgi:hypothetical protein